MPEPKDPMTDKRGRGRDEGHERGGRRAGAHEHDERFVAFLRREAAGYHAPPETPADALWPAVQAGWRLAAGGGQVDAGGGRVDDLELAPDVARSGDPELDRPAGDLLRAGAAEYRRPPEPPRDEMWARVEAAWQLRSAAPAGAREAGWEALPGGRTPPRELAPDGDGGAEAGAGTGGGRISDLGRRLASPRLLWPAGIAAALVLGALIGRGTMPRPAVDAGRVAAEAGMEPTPAATRGRETDGETPLAGAGDAEPAERPERTGTAGDRVEPLPDAPSADGAGLGVGERMAAADPERASEARGPGTGERTRETSAAAAARGEPEVENTVGRLAATRHLARVETFLTSFRLDGSDADREAGAGPWARELLTETRLLLDWSASEDPRLRPLLEELELVLVQIVRLGEGTEEHEWVVEAMERRNVLSRLRATTSPERPMGVAGT